MGKTIKEVKFNVHVIMDSMGMFSGVNWRDDVSDAIAQGDEDIEDLRDTVVDGLYEAEEDDLADEVSDVIMESQIEQVMKHLTVCEDEIEFDYENASYLDDRADVAFRVPCLVDVKGLLGEFLPPDKVNKVIDHLPA